MSFLKLRFYIVGENEEKWVVIDTESGSPACFGAEVLQGLTELQAQTFATILNDIHPPRMLLVNAADDEKPLRLN